MIVSPTSILLPIEILLETIVSQYLNHSYCITIVSETSLNFDFNTSFTYITPNDNDITDRILEVSEMGCSDYIVRMKSPQHFMEAFEEVNHIGIIRKSDRKLIFLPYDENTSLSMLSLLTMKAAEYVRNMLLIVSAPESAQDDLMYDIVTHNFFGDDESIVEPVYLDKWNSSTMSFAVNANLFPHDMKNLQGKTVKVACFTYKPYSILDLDPRVARNGRDGTEVRVVDEFCRWVNCTIALVPDDVFEWGEIYENRTGVGVLGNVVEDRADLGISALYSWFEEFVHLDFSIPTVRTAITCIAPAPRMLVSWEMPLLPFSWLMWLVLIVAFFYSATAVSIAQRTSNKAFLTTFGMMVSQSQDDAGGSWRVRSVTGWLLVTGLVLDNAYGAGLAATFTVPKYEKSIDTIQDIVDNRVEWGATHDAWIFSLIHSEDPLIKQLIRQFHINSAEAMKRKSFTREMAFSIEKLPAGYFAIGEYITKEAAPKLMVMLENFYYEYSVVMMRKSSPYTRKMNDLLGRLHEAGLMLAWETQVALKHLNFKVQLEVKLSRAKKDVEEIEPLNFRHVVGLFFLYLAGVITAILLFVIELCARREKVTPKTISTVIDDDDDYYL